MAINVTIIHAPDFIKATARGHLDLEAAKKLLLEIASASAHSDEYEIILDLRFSESALSVTDVWMLVIELFNFRKAFGRKTAVLCPVERFDHAAFFALCAKNRGFKIEAFTSYEDAIEWLVEKRDA